METSATGQTVLDESVLDSTHSLSNVDDNIISSEKAESSQDQNNGGKPRQKQQLYFFSRLTKAWPEVKG